MSKVEGNDTITMEFTYNHAGLRTKKVKKVNGIVAETTEYILNGKNVVELIHTDNTTGTTPTVNKLHFLYDTQDKQAIVEFNGVKYSYAHNLQGDVIGIIDSTGNIVVQYSYDAWGKPISTTADSTLTTKLAELNPFRYRGYVWDEETAMHYLQNRYYSTGTYRFINPDIFLNAEKFYYSTFAYCANNAVRKADINGEWSITALFENIKQQVLNAIIPQVNIKREGFTSEIEAARAFSNEVYSSSYYICFEYVTTIYSYESLNGSLMYGYTLPIIGEPHSAIPNLDYYRYKSSIVAYAHTHPNSNEFSKNDTDFAESHGINGYVVGPNLELQLYYRKSKEIYSCGTISPRNIGIDEKIRLVIAFSSRWRSHIETSCDFDCQNKPWPAR